MESLKSCLPPLSVDGNSASENERQKQQSMIAAPTPLSDSALAVLPPQLPTATHPRPTPQPRRLLGRSGGNHYVQRVASIERQRVYHSLWSCPWNRGEAGWHMYAYHCVLYRKIPEFITVFSAERCLNISLSSLQKDA